METKENILFKYPVILAIFAGLAGLILAVIFQVTEPKKLINNKIIENTSRQEVLQTAATFQNAKIGDISFLKGFGKDKQLKGYILKVETRGYSSTISIMVGVDNNFAITGMKILTQAETPGLGTKVTSAGFIKQFLGKPTNALAVKKDGGEINAITGATISSRAVADGVREKIEQFKASISSPVKKK